MRCVFRARQLFQQARVNAVLQLFRITARGGQGECGFVYFFACRFSLSQLVLQHGLWINVSSVEVSSVQRADIRMQYTASSSANRCPDPGSLGTFTPMMKKKKKDDVLWGW